MKELKTYSDTKNGVSYINIKKQDMKRQPGTLISLFSGAGGFDIGAEMAGVKTLACVEIDDDCRETLRHNRPEWKLFEDDRDRLPGDIRKISPDELLEFVGKKPGEVDYLIGGAPCQPFSNMGKKLGKDDPKNGDLFLEFVKMVKGIKPKAFVFENVSGIVHSKHSDVVRYMYDHLENLGYTLSSAILNAADYGVPQKRERFFLIGIKGSDKPAFPLPTHFRNEKSWSVFLKSLDPVPGGYMPDKWISVEEAFSRIPRNVHLRPDFALMNISDTVKKRMTYIGPGENFKVLPMELRPNCWKSGKHQGHDTFGRIKPDEPAPTIRTAAYNPSKGRYIHPFENRGLSTVEMAVLQTFPESWVFKCRNRNKVTLVSAGRQIGNAVPPLLSKAIFDALQLQLK